MILGLSDFPEILLDSILDARKLLSFGGRAIHPRGLRPVAVAWNTSIPTLPTGGLSEITLAMSELASPTS